LALLPAAVATFAWTTPGERWVSALWTLLGTGGFTYFLAVMARNKGKQLESQLWAVWGGPPTTQLLRHSGVGNPISRERWHKQLARLLGQPFPTAEEESANPPLADDVYQAAVKLLIGRTRDEKRFPLVYRENVHYGFCRNLYAMKPTGIVISSFGAIASLAAGWRVLSHGAAQLAPWSCAVINGLFLFWWLFTVNSEWVKIPAFAYAERLLESTENLFRPKVQKQSDGKS
jgi:hypothetical protein